MSALAHSADTDPGAARILRRILGFARLARSNGFRVGIEESADALRVANVAGALDKRALRFGLRALFCSCTTDWGKFDELFDLYWRDVGRRSARCVAIGKSRHRISGCRLPGARARRTAAPRHAGRDW
jgi:uncharacterized protein with von Willebrand factor type A (vWA) domain